jgi:hypothetical protein
VRHGQNNRAASIVREVQFPNRVVNDPKYRSYTHLVKDELTDIPMKASTQMAQTINEVGIEQLKRMF